MNSEWMTSTVYALCNSMRQRQCYDELPLLADALEDAGCDDAALITRLRSNPGYVMAATDVCRVLGGEYAAAVSWLESFTKEADCPGYEDTVSAAIGINLYENQKEDDIEINGRVYDMSGYYEAGLRDWGEQYLHFGGRDAHGEIPTEFWDHVSTVIAKQLPPESRASSFSCSC